MTHFWVTFIQTGYTGGEKGDQKNDRALQKCFAIQSRSKTMYILKQCGATKQKRVDGGVRRKKAARGERNAESG